MKPFQVHSNGFLYLMRDERLAPLLAPLRAMTADHATGGPRHVTGGPRHVTGGPRVHRHGGVFRHPVLLINGA